MTDLTPDQTQTELIERAQKVVDADADSFEPQATAITLIAELVNEIQRLDRVVERLGDESLFLPLIKVMAGLGPQVNWVKEFDARFQYARDNRYPK